MKLLRRLVLCSVAMVLAGNAFAQAYPSKPVRMVVGFPAGGPADIFGRAFAQALSANLGQPVIVENKSGVAGVLGMDAVAKSTPDGYTLGFNNQTSLAMAPYTMARIPYEPRRDFALITTVVRVPEVLVTHPSVPVSSLAELIALIKASPGKINYASTGAGSITHLGAELLKMEAKIDMVHIAYKGAAPAVNDLLGGQVQLGIFDLPVVLPHIKSGRLKPLTLTSGKRAQALPEVPTTGELGYPRVNSDNWYGLIAPAATPPDVLKRVHAAAFAALNSPALVEQFTRFGGIAAPGTPEEYGAFLVSEQTKWGAIIKAIDFKED